MPGACYQLSAYGRVNNQISYLNRISYNKRKEIVSLQIGAQELEGYVHGLGSILCFQRKLDAAEFFCQRAINLVKKLTGINHSEAIQDLRMTQYYKKQVENDELVEIK